MQPLDAFWLTVLGLKSALLTLLVIGFPFGNIIFFP
jgi:hypothetical protein